MPPAPRNPWLARGAAVHLVLSAVAALAVHRRIRAFSPGAPAVATVLEAAWLLSVALAALEVLRARWSRA